MKSTNKFAMKKFLFAGLTFFAIILIGFLYAYFLQLGIEK